MEVASVEENHLIHAPFVQEFLAGTVGGCCEVLVGHPFDSVKVRMQTQSSKNPIYSGAVDCFKKVVAKEKFSGLYRGVTPPLVTVGFCSAIIFSSNGYFRRMLNPDPNQPLENLSIWRTGVAGAMTGCIISCFYCPMEFLKIRMQTQTMFNASYSSMGDCAKQIISKHGAMTLYRGFLPTVLRDSACFAGYFMCYNTMKSYYLKNHSKDGEIPLWYLLFSGGMSGISCWLTSYPQDIIKSNMQTSNERVTVRQVIRRIYGDMGVRGFFKGFAPTLLRSFPANGATFFGYELALSAISKSSS